MPIKNPGDKLHHLGSSPLWNAPSMVRNYRYALEVNDRSFIKLFEQAYSHLPSEALDKLSTEEYKLSDDGETVLIWTMA